MDLDKRFTKYQWVELEVTKASDPRPESFTPNVDSIRIDGSVSSEANWRDRKVVVLPLAAHCLCCIERQLAAHGSPTLGIFKPKMIRRLLIEPDSVCWTADELAKLRQYPLFATVPKTELEKIPFKFKYEFQCADDNCMGHTISCTDWELGQAYRRWKQRYGPGWEDKFRERFERDMIEKNDTHFYVGTLRGHPATWIIVGLFYPRL